MFALCLSISSTLTSWSVVVGSEGLYSILSFWSLGLAVGEIKRAFGACRSTDSGDMGCWEILKEPVGRASKWELIGWLL